MPSARLILDRCRLFSLLHFLWRNKMIRALMAATAPVVDEKYSKEIEKARRDLRALISIKKCAPIMLRLAWHDAGTYDAKSRTGGPNGSIRNKEEYMREENTGLKTAIDLCEEVKAKHPRVTYADLYQLAGVVAVELTGGPTINFAPGRKDSSKSPNKGLLPDSKKGPSHLRDVFYRMGLSDKDIVALSGVHTFNFDNSYFVKLLNGDSDPTDKALMDDPDFRSYVQLYVKDEEAFFKDYAESHKKLSELGFTRLVSEDDANNARSAVNTAVACTLIIISYTSQLISYIHLINRNCKEQ